MPSIGFHKAVYSVPCIVNNLPPKKPKLIGGNGVSDLPPLQLTASKVGNGNLRQHIHSKTRHDVNSNGKEKTKKRKRGVEAQKNSENRAVNLSSNSNFSNKPHTNTTHSVLHTDKTTENNVAKKGKRYRKRKREKTGTVKTSVEKKVEIKTNPNVEKKRVNQTLDDTTDKKINGVGQTSQLSVAKGNKKRRPRKKKQKETNGEELITSTTSINQTSTPISYRPTVPKDSSQFSQNWKKLLENMPELKTTKKKIIQKGPPKTEKETSSSDIWFEGVTDLLIQQSRKRPLGDAAPVQNEPKRRLVRPNSYTGVTPILGIDCEMVGVGPGGLESMLARVSIVNRFGNCIYDKYVKPTEKVVDYRTEFSGIRPKDLENAEDPATVQKEVCGLLKGKILVGHALGNDLKVLYLSHNRHKIRDTSSYKPFVELSDGRTPSLRLLTQSVLGIQIQDGEHDSVIDAQAAMRLYTLHRRQWEKDIKLARKLKKPLDNTEQPGPLPVAGVSADV